jgi:hypothetical protein
MWRQNSAAGPNCLSLQATLKKKSVCGRCTTGSGGRGGEKHDEGTLAVNLGVHRNCPVNRTLPAKQLSVPTNFCCDTRASASIVFPSVPLSHGNHKGPGSSARNTAGSLAVLLRKLISLTSFPATMPGANSASKSATSSPLPGLAGWLWIQTRAEAARGGDRKTILPRLAVASGKLVVAGRLR